MKTIDIKIQQPHIKISVEGKEIELSDMISLNNNVIDVFPKEFLNKKILEINFSTPSMLNTNKENLDYLTEITGSISEIISPHRIIDYKNIYRIGFKKSYQINISH